MTRYKTTCRTPYPADWKVPAREQIVAQVKARREALGLSQNELSKIVGTSSAVICRMEAYHMSTNLDMLHRVAEALGCTLIVTLEPKVEA